MKHFPQTLLHRLEQVSRGIEAYVNLDKTMFMGFKQNGAIFQINDGSLKLVDLFPYLENNILSTESELEKTALLLTCY